MPAVEPPAGQPFILFISGSSASGKTTLYDSLQADPSLAHLRFHDIDENGVPPVGRGPWRQFRVEELLYEATEALREGVSTVICGISKPHEVIESAYFDPGDRIHFLVLEIPFATLEERIRQRVADQAAQVAFDECFNPGAMAEFLLASRNLQRELRNAVSQQRRGHLLEVADLTPVEMHRVVVALIRQIAGAPAPAVAG
jgi:hypothetical protein